MQNINQATMQIDHSCGEMVCQSLTPMLLCCGDLVHVVSRGFVALTGFSAPLPLPLSDVEQLIGLSTGHLSYTLEQTPGGEHEWVMQPIGKERILCTVKNSKLEISSQSLDWLVITDRTEQRGSEQVLGQILAEVSVGRGMEYFNRLTRVLCQTLPFDGACVSIVHHQEQESAMVLSFWMDNTWLPAEAYPLSDSPFQQVLREGEQFYATGIQGLFPSDSQLQGLNVEGFIGLPLYDEEEQVIGLIALFSRQAIKVSDDILVLMRTISERTAIECQRKQADERLAVSELGLSAAEYIANFGSWVVDIERQVVALSDGMQKLYQLKAIEGELPRSVVIDRIHPDDREWVAKEIAQGERGGKPYSFNHRILCDDNQVRWIRTGCQPVWDQGVLVKILGISQDITALTAYQQQLMNSEKQYRHLVESCPYGITQIDTNLNFTFANPVAEKILGYSLEELKGNNLMKLVPEEDQKRTRELYDKLLRSPVGLVNYRRKGKMPDGSIRELDITLNYLLDDNGDVSGFIGFLTDITEKVRKDTRLRQLSTAVEQSPSAVLITNKAGVIEYVNPAFESNTGYLLEELEGQTPRILNGGSNDSAVFEAMWSNISSGRSWRGELLNKRKDGSLYWELASVAPIRSKSGEITHYVSINEDISVLKDQEAQLAYQANYDPVTNLPNRVLAMDRLINMLASAKRNGLYAVVMFIDLDQFKRINDTFGHSVGDQLLVSAANTLQSTIREGDTVARFGGDEFVILMDDLPDVKAVEKVSEKVLRAFNRPVSIGDHELTITASIGIAVYPQDGNNAEVLLSNADAAMYSAKAHGRNSFHFFTPELNQHAQQRLQMESLLLKALELEEMSVHYQPVVDFDSGQVVGAEALLRWSSGQLGVVGPDMFIPLAEDLGLIDELGDWVIDQVLKQYQQWAPLLAEGFRCAINVSPKQFQRGQFAKRMLEKLSHYQVPGTAIELEVTEGLLMHNWPEIDQQVQALSEAGLSLSIDDFGTGYSSISYLRKYPFNTLKIDRSFVMDLMDDKEDETLVLSVIALAQGMGMAIIAEGVETMEQYNFLKNARCSMMQGYLFSRPVPADSFETLLKDGSCMDHD